MTDATIDAASKLAWAKDACLSCGEMSPENLLEALMAHPKCPAFGPTHHFLVGAALLTCLRRVQGLDDEVLAADLNELLGRSSLVPGATCARWGICGAAISAGMAYAVAADNAPLKHDGWSEGQRMVANIAARIAESGAPRCCKRDSRIAIETAARVFEQDFGVLFPICKPLDPCAVSSENTVCMANACPFFAGTDARTDARGSNDH